MIAYTKQDLELINIELCASDLIFSYVSLDLFTIYTKNFQLCSVQGGIAKNIEI